LGNFQDKTYYILKVKRNVSGEEKVAGWLQKHFWGLLTYVSDENVAGGYLFTFALLPSSLKSLKKHYITIKLH
jgi:hypothetical protein